ncbi:MAG: type IV pilus assembly protein PilM [Candidatus Sungbacteria bacterium]|nr:type IV pilus assembly protein PilM [Candidatus Sungbacteria bacterium]
MDIPFLKKIMPPSLSLGLFSGKPKNVVGVDIGTYSTKVVQLRYESERAILETYGELLTEGYLKNATGGGGGFLRFLDNDIATLLKDVFRESNITARDAILSIPTTAGFTITIHFPKLDYKEIEGAVPLEARKYVPIPLNEVILDWTILEQGEERDTVEVLLIAVPKEVVEKFKRVAQLTGIRTRALEIETFSVVRSLIGRNPTPTAIINMGHRSTALSIADHGSLRISHNFNRGSFELTRALERGLSISHERAETVKRETGLSDKLEEREITSIISPLLETLFAEIGHTMQMYNRTAARKIQKVELTGGGSQLKGIIDLAASRFGIEVARANPFGRVVSPAFIQPMLQEISPLFSVAVGLALHQITSH